MNSSGSGGGLRRDDTGGTAQGAEGTWTDGADGFAQEERVRAAVQRRRRDRWRRELQVGDSTLLSAARAATGSSVVVHLSSSATVQGVVAVAGVDVLGVQHAGSLQWLPAHALRAITLDEVPGDDPEREDGPTFAGVVEDLRGTAHVVSVRLTNGSTLRGRIVGSGRTVVLQDLETRGYTVIDPGSVESILV